MIYGVAKGKTVPGKHFALVLGLHNISRKKMKVEINNKLGHCINDGHE